MKDIYRFLKASVPDRFGEVDPYDFEDFVEKLFQDRGYSTNNPGYSGDFGADLIVEKDNRIAVQVKRYQAGNRVGVSDLNQVLGAANYYDCDQAMLVTTSGFTRQAQKLGEQTGVELIAWPELQRMISETYFSGQDYSEYYSNSEYNENVQISLCDVEYGVEIDNINHTVLHCVVENKTDENVELEVESAYYNNVELDSNVDELKIYAGDRKELQLQAYSFELKNVRPGDMITLEYENNGVLESQEIEVDRRYSHGMLKYFLGWIAVAAVVIAIM